LNFRGSFVSGLGWYPDIGCHVVDLLDAEVVEYTVGTGRSDKPAIGAPKDLIRIAPPIASYPGLVDRTVVR
jgi:hypothetical protein